MNLVPGFIQRRFANRPKLVRVVDNIGWLFFDKVLRLGVGLFVGVWIARYLGPEQFGLLNFALAITGLFGALAALGLSGVVVRDLVRDPEGAHETLGTTAALQLVGGLVAYLAVLLVIAWLRPEDATARGVVAVLGSIMLLKASEVTIYWFEANVQSKYTVWVQNGVFLLFAVAKVVLILRQAPLMAFAWAMLAEATVVAGLMVTVFHKRGPGLTALCGTVIRARTLLTDSWPLILSSIAVLIYMKIDQLMLGQILGNEAVGIYSAAVRLSEIWYFVPAAIVASVFPAILEAKERSEEFFAGRLQKLYDVVVLLSLGIALPTTVFATPIVTLLFGESYAAAGSVLAIHIWASIFVALALASGKWILAENRNALLFQRHLLAAILNVVLNSMMIPKYGINGAAMATLVAWVASSYLFDLAQACTRQQFRMKTASLNVIGSLTRLIVGKRLD